MCCNRVLLVAIARNGTPWDPFEPMAQPIMSQFRALRLYRTVSIKTTLLSPTLMPISDFSIDHSRSIEPPRRRSCYAFYI